MPSPYEQGDITPAIIPIVTKSPDSKPITPNCDRGTYDMYAGRFTQVKNESDEYNYLRDQPTNIGRMAVKKALDSDQQSIVSVAVALLNETAACMPDEPIDDDMPDSENVKFTGDIHVDITTIHDHEHTPQPGDIFKEPHTQLLITASILHDGRALLMGMYAAHSCHNTKCENHFHESSQMKLIHHLGLENIFHQNSINLGEVIISHFKRQTLTLRQTERLGNFLLRHFLGPEYT